MVQSLRALGVFLVVAGVLGTTVFPALAKPPKLPQHPVRIYTDKDAYKGKEHITVSVENSTRSDVWIQPFLTIDRGNGDGTFTPVYRLYATETCPHKVPEKPACVRVAAGRRMTLVPWDWSTGGYHQCPPRRPGHRAFKGVHRIIADWCSDRKKPELAAPRIKWVTWE